MTDPRTPTTREGQLPDPLDQVPEAHAPLGHEGAPDADLLAEAAQGEADIEQMGAEQDDGDGDTP